MILILNLVENIRQQINFSAALDEDFFTKNSNCVRINIKLSY